MIHGEARPHNCGSRAQAAGPGTLHWAIWSLPQQVAFHGTICQGRMHYLLKSLMVSFGYDPWGGPSAIAGRGPRLQGLACTGKETNF